MRIQERNDVFIINKEFEMHPYMAINDKTVDPETGDSTGEIWAAITNNIARSVNTSLLKGVLAYTLKEENIPMYYRYKCHPILDIVYSEPTLMTPLTNIVRDEEEDYLNGYRYNMVFPTVMFNVYDMYGGLPTISLPIHTIAALCKKCYQDEEECAVKFINYWMNEVIESYGGKEEFFKALLDENFSRQPVEDAYVLITGRFIDDEIPVNAYGGDIEKAKEQAPKDLAKLHEEYHEIKKIRADEWERFSRMSKKDDEERALEYKASRKRNLRH